MYATNDLTENNQSGSSRVLGNSLTALLVKTCEL